MSNIREPVWRRP